MARTSPLLLLDVDGVLIPFGMAELPSGYSLYQLGGRSVPLHAHHDAWLRELAEYFELVWATTWETDAADLLAPILGLPEMPVIRFESDYQGETWKLDDVDRFVGTRAAAWVDDDLQADADIWAQERPAQTKLIVTDSSIGLIRAHVDELVAFARSIDEEPVTPS